LTAYLSRAFTKEADADFMRATEALCEKDALEGHRQVEPALHKRGCALLYEAVKAVHNKSLVLERYAVEYAQLFLGVGEHPVSLVESAHRSADHLLYGFSYFEVTEFYAQYTYEPAPSIREPMDHLAVELDFISTQSWRAATLYEAGCDDDALRCQMSAQRFREEHLLLWALAVCERIVAVAKTPLYRGLALLTQAYLT
jgi:TorA maturation chaperone TorD